MRNLKRTLSLLLAAAMLMGMMVVGASAASSTDFTDSSEITREEAVGVMTALGVFEGTDSGAFDPGSILTREQAAAIICRMLLGDDADELTTNSVVFSDVSSDRWSAGYIGYCAQQGILAGTGDGTFDPEGELTGLAFAKMLLVALGYNATSEGYVGTDWSVNVAADALNAGITPSGIVLADALNREDAAQMAFQTLEADMVTYTGSSSTTVTTPDGSSVVITGAAEEITNDEEDDYRYEAADQDDIQQFCEYYFEDLEKRESYPDEFGRPSVRWRLGSSEIGTFSETPDGSYTASVEKGELYDVIGRDAYNDLLSGDASLSIYVNGEEIGTSDTPYEDSDGNELDWDDDTDREEIVQMYFLRNDDDSAASTGRGVLTEVFLDDDNSNNIEVTITHIFTYVAQVDGDYVESDGELDLDPVEKTDLDEGIIGWGQYAGLDIQVDDWTLYDDDFSSLSSYSDGDYVLVTVAQDEIQSISPATELTGEVTAYTRGTSVTVDGTRYYYSKSYSEAVDGDVDYSLNDEYLVIQDDEGYVVYDEGASGVENYVFITAVAPTGGVSSDVEARAYFQTGTETTIELDDDSDATSEADDGNGAYDTDTGSETRLTDYGSRTYVNSWYEYSEQSDGTYDLSNLSSSDSAVITATDDIDLAVSGSAYVYYGNSSGDRTRANNSTVFIINDDDDVNVYTGVRNVPDVTLNDGQTAVVAWVEDEDGYAEVVYIGSDQMSVSGGSDDRVYILDTAYDSSVDTEGNEYFEYEAIVNGEIVSVSASSDSIFDEVGLYSDIQYDSNDYVSDADLVSGTGDDDFKGWVELYDVTIEHSSGILSFNGYRGSSRTVDEDLVLADDCSIFFNDDGDGETTTASSLARDYDDGSFEGHIYVFENDDDEAQEIYVYEYAVDGSSGGDGGDGGDTEEDEGLELATLTIKGQTASISDSGITVTVPSAVANNEYSMAETVAAGTTTSGETPTLTLVDGSGNRTEGSSTDTLTRSSYTLYVTLDGETVQYTLTVTYTETYAVTFSVTNAGVEDADGTDISSGTYAEEGEDFTFYVEASSGYELGDDAVAYSIDGGTSVTLSANSDGSYTIPGSEIQDITTGIAVTVTTAGSAASVELSLKDDVVADLEGSGDAYTLILPQGASSISNGNDLETYLEATGSASDTDISNVASGVTSTGATLTFTSSTGGGQQVITLTIRSATDAETLAYDQALYTEALGERQNVTIDAANNSIDDVAGALEDIIDGTAASPLFGSGETWGSTVDSVEVSTDDYTSWTPPATNGAYTTLELPATITLSMGSEDPVEFQVTVTVRVTYQQA